jgi:hypothetical protein
MKLQMHPISVEVHEHGKIHLTQEYHDLNEPDPIIELSAEQAPLVAAWLYEAAGVAGAATETQSIESIPVRYFARGPEAEAEELKVFSNAQGMIVLKIDDDSFIEIAPAMAKRLREKLSVAIRSSIADMLRPDGEA